MKLRRNLDGYYFRIKRDDSWQTVCFSDMNDDEKQATLNKLSKIDIMNIAKGMANRLYQVGEMYNISM